MKPAITRLLFISLTAVAIWGCKKDNITPKSNPAAFNKLMNDGQNSFIKTTNINLPKIYSYYTIGQANGTLITIPQNTLLKDGAIVSGKAQVDYCEFYDRKSMIIADKPNIALTGNGTYEMLANSCIFHLAARQDGKLLTINNFIRVDIRRQNFIATLDDTMAFDAKTTDDGIMWEPAKNWMVRFDKYLDSYITNVADNNWYAFGRFYNDNRPQTNITVNIPDGYAGASRIYILPKGLINSVGTPKCTFPIGQECYLLFVTERNGQYCWTSKTITIAKDHVENIDLSVVHTGNLTNFADYIDLLK